MVRRTLSPIEAKRFYDRIGARQDTQSFYEDRALERLEENTDLQEATSVIELGCGTGRWARRLLSEHLPEDATYQACDLSGTMVALTRERLRPFGGRAWTVQADGRPPLPFRNESADRLLSTYLLDLLAAEEIRRMLGEGRRILRKGGLAGLVSITRGTTRSSRLVMSLWSLVHRLSPDVLGGCRPIEIRQFLSPERWRIEHRSVVVSWGVASEVVVATSA